MSCRNEISGLTFNQICAQSKELNKEEELKLIQAYKINNDQKARETFIFSNCKLVAKIAKDIYAFNQSLNYEDLCMEGVLGLFHALDLFDYTLGNKFSTYAYPHIKQAMRQAIMDTGSIIRYPANVRDLMNKISILRDKYVIDKEEYPSDIELVEYSNGAITMEDIHSINEVSYKYVSLDAEISDENGDTLYSEVITDYSEKSVEEEVECQELKDKVHTWLNKLENPRLKFALEKKYGIGDGVEHTLKEIGESLGITVEGARQLVKEALFRFKKIVMKEI